MKILVIGKEGQLGSEIHKISSNYNYNWVFTNHNNFDIARLKQIKIVLKKINPDLIINCAAYTSVEKAENDFENANIINHKSVKIIAQWSFHNNCKLIHISTDYVYGKNLNKPLEEDFLTQPINNYGKTKLLGEIACRINNPKSIIIRTSWLYSSFGDNFVKKIIKLIKIEKKLNVVNDQIGSPTFAADLAKAILRIISFKKWKPGIYNYTNIGSISRFDFAKDINSIYGLGGTIIPISSKDYQNIAKRPKYSVLNNTKIQESFDITTIPYLESLKKCIKILKNEA